LSSSGDDVVSLPRRTNCACIGCEPRLEDHAGLDVLEARDFFFTPCELHGAAMVADGPDPTPYLRVASRAASRSLDGGKAEIIVRGEIDKRACRRSARAPSSSDSQFEVSALRFEFVELIGR